MPPTLGRNDPCHCGSGKKYKYCCQESDRSTWMSKTALIVLALVVILGLVLVGNGLTSEDSQSTCPPGTTWSEAHQHCH